MKQRLPWQQPQWQRLQQQIAQQRIPHALLLHGTEGSGKQQFAEALAEQLLCETPAPSREACGECASCKLLQAETHPDLIQLQPEEGKQVLAVDQVRSMVEEFGYTPQIAQRKVVLLHPAERMNVNAANSLLKTLEEPPGEAVMILVSHTPARLLATIRSRCQQIAFPLPTEEEAHQWLQTQLPEVKDLQSILLLSERAPLKALQLSDPEQLDHYQQMGSELIDLLGGRADPIRVALRWSDKKLDPTTTLRWLQQWVTLLIKGESKGEPLTTLSQRLQRADRQQLFHFYDKVTQAIPLASTPVHRELLFQGILLDWRKFR